MKVIATDLWGNEKVLDCPWTVDNKELTIPISVPASPVSGTVNVGFQPKADGADVARAAQLYIDGVKVADTGLGPYTYSWDTTRWPTARTRSRHACGGRATRRRRRRPRAP